MKSKIKSSNDVYSKIQFFLFEIIISFLVFCFQNILKLIMNVVVISHFVQAGKRIRRGINVIIATVNIEIDLKFTIQVISVRSFSCQREGCSVGKCGQGQMKDDYKMDRVIRSCRSYFTQRQYEISISCELERREESPITRAV